MTETYDGIVARMKDKFTQLAGYSPDDASDIGIRLKVLAGEIYSVCGAVDWLRRQTFAQTASGTELEYRALERGLTRKPAAAAAGVLTFGRSTALWYDAKIPAGTVCASSGSGAAQYATTQDAVLKQGSLTVDAPAAAEEPGVGGNTEAATVTAMVTPPAAVETVTNAAAFTGGEDAETDDSLRARLLASYSEPANGTNAAWYRRTALACDGIRSANVVPRANGAGTVAVYLGGAGGPPSDAEVEQAADFFSSQKEINVDVTVRAAQTAAVDVTCTAAPAAGQSSSDTVHACRRAILDYFAGLGVGEPVVVSAMTAKLMETGAVTDCAFSSAGKTVAANQLAAIGNLTVTAGT